VISPPVSIFQVNTLRLIFFIAGLSNLLRVKINVEIIPIEIVCFFVGVFSLLSSNTRKLESSDTNILKFLNLFLTLSLVTQLSVDSFYNVSFAETIKSCAQTLVIWALLRVALIYMQPDFSRFIFYVSGYLLSVSIQYFVAPSIYAQTDPWKFAFGPTITGLYFLLLKSRLPFLGNVTFLILLVSVDVLLGSRSLALFTILAFFLTLPARRIRNNSVAKIFLISISLITLIFGIERAYYHLSTTGALGESQQLKSIDQYKAGPILFTGRSEIAFELAAIKSNPVFGLGSNPDLTFNILNDTQQINQYFGVQTEATNAYKATIVNGKIPQHSVIFSAWIEGGVVIVGFWMVIFIWVVRKFGQISKTNPPLGNYAAYIGLATVWALLFSPLGAGSRMELAVGLATLLLQSKFGENAYKN
jgi:hypothetical protein